MKSLGFVSILFLGLCAVSTARADSDEFSKPDFIAKPWYVADVVDWAQPPVGCVEEVVPSKPARPCPDLSKMSDPWAGLPSGLSEEDVKFWKRNKRLLQYCQYKEVMDRETAHPGSQNSYRLEMSWMGVLAATDSEEKIRAVYEMSRLHGMPVQVLTGALYQESVFSGLGIADDGGNFSCGVGQVNITEWCSWISRQGIDLKNSMGWPENVDCENERLVDPVFIKPLYEIAKTRLNGLSEYRLMKEHFQDIPLEKVVKSWPEASDATQQLRYKMVRSFIDNCSGPRYGIYAKAQELANLFKNYVPDALKAKDKYTGGAKFMRTCQENGNQENFPLHTGWVLAVSFYNAGPKIFDLIAHYNGWDRAAVGNTKTWEGFSPKQMINSEYWGGKYATGDLVQFRGLRGESLTYPWFKTCVAQRHVARVAQHVTIAENDFVDTLEGDYPCKKPELDPKTGKVLKSGVPDFRQKSSGVKGR